MAFRLSIAFFVSILIAIGCWLILPNYGVYLPAWIPLLAFGVMAVACVLSELEQDKDDEHDDDDEDSGDDEGRSLTCCGPRPVGEMSRRASQRCCRK